MLKAFYSNILWLANIYTPPFLFYRYIGWNVFPEDEDYGA